MTTYTDVFGNNTVAPSGYQYVAVALSANTTFEWPENAVGDDLIAAIMDVTPSGAGLEITLPAANGASTGRDILIRNVGSDTFTIKDNGGSTITTAASGTAKYLFITSNSTAAGTWGVFTYGTGTSSADASAMPTSP
jgi:hypothetical protein